MVEGTGLRTHVFRRWQSSLRTSLFRNSLLLIATSVLGYGLSFLFWLAVARAYPASSMGLGATLLSTLLFLSGVATLGLPIGIIRFLPAEPDKVGLINASFTVSGLVSLALGLVFLAGLDLWAPALSFLRSDPLFVAAYVLSLVFFAFAGIFDAAFVAARRADYGMIRNTIYSLIRLPFPLAVAAVLGVFGILFSWTVALLVSLVVGAFVLLPRLFPGYRPAPSFRRIRNLGIVGYSLWNHASGLVGTAAVSLLPLLILNTAAGETGAAATAYFYAAFALASLLYVVPGSFSTALFVEGSHPETDYARDVRSTVWLSLGFLALGIVGAVLLGRFILGLFGEAYARESYETLILLVLASPIILVNTVFTTDLRVAKRVKPLLIITAISSVATLSVAYVLLPTTGIWGAGAGFVFGQALAAPLFALERRRNGRRGMAAQGFG